MRSPQITWGEGSRGMAFFGYIERKKISGSIHGQEAHLRIYVLSCIYTVFSISRISQLTQVFFLFIAHFRPAEK